MNDQMNERCACINCPADGCQCGCAGSCGCEGAEQGCLCRQQIRDSGGAGRSRLLPAAARP